MDPICVLSIVLMVLGVRVLPRESKRQLEQVFDDLDFERKAAFWFLAAGITAVMAYSFFRWQGGP